jgi:phosphoribosyl 1,2-cyclic phosphate phosphodiesterase
VKITFLGTGTSQGVPVILCGCKVCTSSDPRDQRLRTSVMIESNDGRITVIDTGPDFRQQMLREKPARVDAVVFTHAHKDHIAGLDDVRPFNFATKQDMPVYGSEEVMKALEREYYYVFEAVKYPGVPQITVHTIDNTPFELNGCKFEPIQLWHHRMPVFGFRIGNFAYITDANLIPEEEMLKLKGLKVLVINALRKETHISHFNLEQALEIIGRLQPEQAYLTHISHQLGLHAEEEALLPQSVRLAYDGLKIEV